MRFAITYSDELNPNAPRYIVTRQEIGETETATNVMTDEEFDTYCQTHQEEHASYLAWLETQPKPEPTPEPIQLSKLTIRRKLRELGKEIAFNYFLSQNSQVQNDWDDATVIMSNDPLFTSYAPVVKAALNLTDEQFNYVTAS